MIKLPNHLLALILIAFQLLVINSEAKASVYQQNKLDEIAERMLLFQRSNGGWTQYQGNATDYRKSISEEQKAILLSDKNKLDATIDDKSTTYEINYLVKAYAETKNPAYLKAAEKGIDYLLAAQNIKGGWPQRYPDTTSYHKYITYNDNAMVDVLWVLKNTADKTTNFAAINSKLAGRAGEAVKRGIACILKTQYVQNGKLTAWGAQHDNRTLQPAPARKFELASLSSSESVGIAEFLMSMPNPGADVKKAVQAAVAWLESVKVVGYAYQNIQDKSQPSGRDRVLVPKPNGVLWARFYELETNKPIFAGRDAIKRYAVAEIENERRVGYGWYNTRPAELLSKSYPEWAQKWKVK